MKYYIIAGEASGDLHGSNLMRGLYAEDKSASIRFWGGPLMDSVYREHQSGEGLVKDYSEGAVIGFSQVILHIGKYLRRLSDCMKDIIAFSPDAVILIDYPGFNFRVAEAAHKKGLRVFYYIAPKVWASREGRIRKLKAYVDRLFIVFPFEKEYFERKGVPYTYKGNPLIDAIDSSPALAQSREDFLSENSLPDKRFIALLAGSRKGEVASMMSVFMQFVDMLGGIPGYEDFHFLVAGAPSRTMEDYAAFISGRKNVHVLFGKTYAVLHQSEAAVINSGTASLEACLVGTPQVVAYACSDFNFDVAKHIVKVECISLGNLILGRKAFKELMQYHFTPENLVSETRRLIEDSAYREGMIGDYALIRDALGGKGASREVAKAMIAELSKGEPRP